MGAIEGKIFEAGESGPLRLPEEFDIPPGTKVTIERNGLAVTIRPVQERDRARLNNQRLAAELRAIWAETGPPPPEVRDPDIFPDRPVLY